MKLTENQIELLKQDDVAIMPKKCTNDFDDCEYLEKLGFFRKIVTKQQGDKWIAYYSITMKGFDYIQDIRLNTDA